MPYQIEQSLCSGCHQCAANCPTEAITFKGTKYWIDPEKCAECGACVSHCHNGIIKPAGTSGAARKAHDTLNMSCDILVLGGGGSGLIAAARAAELTGGKVIVLEKNWETGGNTWYACGFRAHYSKLHKKLGMPDDREARIDKLYSDINGALSRELLHNTLDFNTRFMDWLFDRCGADGEISIGLSPSGNPAVVFADGFRLPFKRPDTSIGPGGLGSYVVLKMREKCRELGVEIITGCAAEKLLTDETGAVIGACANDGGGTVIIRSSSTILATGCFSRSRELLEKTNPDVFLPGEPIHFFSVPTCTGDGIKLAEGVGAAIDLQNVHVVNMGPAHHPFGYAGVCISRQPQVVYINKSGRRWCAELNRPANNDFLKQPGLIHYAVADSSIVDAAARDIIAHTVDGPDGVAAMERYRDEIESEAKMDTPVKKADSLEELAGLMDVPVNAFLDEIRKYNDFCRSGHDLDFGKDARFLVPIENPPFFAFYGKRFQENAMGGAVIDPELSVVDSEGRAIPGLLACGDNCRGVVMPEPETFRVEMTISALTWAVSSGFMAGEKAAEYIKRT